jgi:hypothetical protein
VRIHLGLAALILIGGIVAGWWFQQAPHTPHDPVEMRDAIASGDAVVVTFRRQGSSAGPATTITFIRDKGWIWQRPAHANAAAMVISKPSETLAAAAPGCYIAIQDVAAPVVPGVNLASDLGHAPGLKVSGDLYTYQVSDEEGNATVGLDVREDLSGIAQTQTFTASLSLALSGAEQHVATVAPGTYTVRRATGPERKAAEQLLASAKASPVATFTVAQRAVGPDQPIQTGAIQMVSPRACPGAVVLDPEVLGKSPTLSVFTESNPKAILGVAIQTAGGQVSIAGVLPVDLPITAPADRLLAELTSATPQDVVLRRGVTFGLAPATGPTWPVLAIAACQPQPWFPC